MEVNGIHYTDDRVHYMTIGSGGWQRNICDCELLTENDKKCVCLSILKESQEYCAYISKKMYFSFFAR